MLEPYLTGNLLSKKKTDKKKETKTENASLGKLLQDKDIRLGDTDLCTVKLPLR